MNTQEQYTYSRGTDGCEETFDIYDPSGEMMASIHFWEAEAWAEATASLIVNALNAYSHGKELVARATAA